MNPSLGWGSKTMQNVHLTAGVAHSPSSGVAEDPPTKFVRETSPFTAKAPTTVVSWATKPPEPQYKDRGGKEDTLAEARAIIPVTMSEIIIENEGKAEAEPG